MPEVRDAMHYIRHPTDPALNSDDERLLKEDMRNQGRKTRKSAIAPIDVDEMMDVSEKCRTPISACCRRPTRRKHRGGYSMEILKELGSTLQEMACSAAS